MSAPTPRPERLPGAGHRLDLVDEEGRAVPVVLRKDGTLELHHGPREAVTVLDPTATRALGALAGGHFTLPPDLIERTDEVLGGISFDWVTVPAGSWVAGLSIEAAAVRRRTGTTIVAILRGSTAIIDPGRDERLEPGDALVIVGRPDDRTELQRFLREGR